jgi:hypothetical protein
MINGIEADCCFNFLDKPKITYLLGATPIDNVSQ